MTTIRRRSEIALLVVVGIGVIGSAPAARAQGSPPASALRDVFRKFDTNESGWLSGRELTACGCVAFDSNGDGEVTWEEFAAGFAGGTGAGTAAAAPAPGRDAAPARASDTAQTAYVTGDRVDVNYGGTWYPGTIYGVRDGTYKVMRDAFTSDDRWVPSADLRRLARVVRAEPRRGALPRAIPLGTYSCVSVSAGFGTGNASLSGFGKLRITGSSTYTALSRENNGATARYAYDATSGAVDWAGGKLQGFFGTITGSRFAVDSRGIPVITVTYRARAGGNLFDLGCQREGA